MCKFCNNVNADSSTNSYDIDDLYFLHNFMKNYNKKRAAGGNTCS